MGCGASSKRYSDTSSLPTTTAEESSKPPKQAAGQAPPTAASAAQPGQQKAVPTVQAMLDSFGDLAEKDKVAFLCKALQQIEGTLTFAAEESFQQLLDSVHSCSSYLEGLKAQ